MKKVVISTGGGDAPGLNAVIYAVVHACYRLGWEVYGSRSGYAGFLDIDEMIRLTPRDVKEIYAIGGTILGSTNKGSPFAKPIENLAGEITLVDISDKIMRNYKRMGFDCHIAIGGDGTLDIAHRFSKLGMNVIGVPNSGISGGADIILIPEIPFDLEIVSEKIADNELREKHYSIVVVAEGALAKGGKVVSKGRELGREEVILGGIGEWVANEIREMTGKDTRSLTLGHLQRGGSPTTFDRLLALRFGAAAVRLVEEGTFDHMVALDSSRMKAVPIEEAIKTRKKVDLASDKVSTARDIGICFGD
ncbi:MAG: 6-phosphofructokinase [Desulfofustis sp.]